MYVCGLKVIISIIIHGKVVYDVKELIDICVRKILDKLIHIVLGEDIVSEICVVYKIQLNLINESHFIISVFKWSCLPVLCVCDFGLFFGFFFFRYFELYFTWLLMSTRDHYLYFIWKFLSKCLFEFIQCGLYVSADLI